MLLWTSCLAYCNISLPEKFSCSLICKALIEVSKETQKKSSFFGFSFSEDLHFLQFISDPIWPYSVNHSVKVSPGILKCLLPSRKLRILKMLMNELHSRKFVLKEDSVPGIYVYYTIPDFNAVALMCYNLSFFSPGSFNKKRMHML